MKFSFLATRNSESATAIRGETQIYLNASAMFLPNELKDMMNGKGKFIRTPRTRHKKNQRQHHDSFYLFAKWKIAVQFARPAERLFANCWSDVSPSALSPCSFGIETTNHRRSSLSGNKKTSFPAISCNLLGQVILAEFPARDGQSCPSLGARIS